jgi:3-hydroxyacyl-CoA dehydrogenase
LAVEGFRLSGKATAHDAVIGKVLAGVLSGGRTDILDRVTESGLLALEREGFMALVRDPASLARVAHMLKTGKPLRN